MARKNETQAVVVEPALVSAEAQAAIVQKEPTFIEKLVKMDIDLADPSFESVKIYIEKARHDLIKQHLRVLGAEIKKTRLLLNK